MSCRYFPAGYAIIVVTLLSGIPSIAQQSEPSVLKSGSWYRHPQGIFRVPLPDGWKVLPGVRGEWKDKQFDTLADPTNQIWILCWRESEKVSNEMAALDKFEQEKRLELSSYQDVQATGFSINGVPMIRITYQVTADRIVSRTAAVKNGHRVVINTVSPLGPVEGQLPPLVADLLERIEYPNEGVPPEIPNAITKRWPNKDSSGKSSSSSPPTVVREKQNATFGRAGGGVKLPGGLRLVVPPEAVAQETEISVELLNSEVFSGDEPTHFIVLNCTASVPQFKRPVEIRLPFKLQIPENVPPPLAGTLNEETGLLEMCPTRFESQGTSAELVITTDHFCHVVIPSEEGLKDWFESPPASAGPIETGIYKQGKTMFCWAMTMHTQARAYKAGKQSAYSILGDVGLDFAGPADIRWRPSIGNWLHSQAGKEPTRFLWDPTRLTGSDLWLDGLKRYIRRQVGKEGRPVFLGRKAWTKGHSWLIVGYDENENFIVHDSQDPPDITHSKPDMGYYKVSAKELGIDWGVPVRDSYVTIAIPGPLNPQRSLASLNIPHRAIWFTNPTVPNMFVFAWTHATPEGYAWHQAKRIDRPGEAYDAPLPPTVEELHLGAPAFAETGLEVINGSLSDTKQLTVDIEVGKEGEQALHKEQQIVSVGPNRREAVFAIIPVEKFRFPEDTGLTKYRFHATLHEGGAAIDQASFAFEIGPGKWFEMKVTQEQAKHGPYFATYMVPNRIFWCEPAKLNASETQVTLHYKPRVQGRDPLSAGSQPGVSPKITLRAMREGDEYVIRGPELDDVARKAEFSYRHMILMITSKLAELDEDQKEVQINAKRQAAENIKVAVESIEFRLRPEGDTLRLAVRGKATSTFPSEEPKASEANMEIVGTAEKE